MRYAAQAPNRYSAGLAGKPLLPVVAGLRPLLLLGLYRTRKDGNRRGNRPLVTSGIDNRVERLDELLKLGLIANALDVEYRSGGPGVAVR